MNVFQRSWALTKASFGVVKKKKTLLVFPIVSFIVSALFLVIVAWPTYIVAYLSGAAYNWWVTLLIVFFQYLVLAVISTFTNVCLVYTAAGMLKKKPKKIGFFSAVRFAFSKFNLIVGWAMISATVGIIFYILDSASRNKNVGGLIASIVRFGLGIAWKIMTIMIIPVMVFNDVGPFEALKMSGKMFKRVWGEHLVRKLSHGLIAFLLVLAGIGIFVLGCLLVWWQWPSNWMLYVYLGIGLFVYFLILALVFNVANKVYDTALYMYADKGHIPKLYKGIKLNTAFAQQG
ncbi:MAG: DUF6159 family protein [Promethearchaeota archaeon]